MPDRSGHDPEFDDAIAKPAPRRGFRLVEFLAALAVLALLVAFLMPATRSARPAARRMQCSSNLKQIALALHNYEQAHGMMPPGFTTDAAGRPLHSWRTLILPHLDLDDLYQTIDLSKPWDDPANAKARETPVPVFHCPEATGPRNTTTYLAIVAPDGCFAPGTARRPAEIKDARGSTLMVIEAGEEAAVPWMAPADAGESLVMGLGPATKLHHAGGTNVALVDGSVRFFKATTPAKVRRALVSISGGDDPSADEW
jgi:prepilin-type processing-associated H-X9-DG protein